MVANIKYSGLALAILSGLLSGFCLPAQVNDPLSPLKVGMAFISLTPLYWVLGQEKSRLKAFGYALLAGLIHNLTGWFFLLGIHPLSWIGLDDQLSLLASWIGWIGASTEQALFWGLFGVLYVVSGQLLVGFRSFLPASLAVLWVFCVEILPGGFSLKIPWHMIYLSLAADPVLSQGAYLLGAHGLSFLLVLVNTTSSSLITEQLKHQDLRKTWTITHRVLIGTGLVLLAFVGYGLYRVEIYKASPPVKALLVQENLTTLETRINRPGIERYIPNIKASLKAQPSDLVIMPEGALSPTELQSLATILRSDFPSVSLLAGSYIKEGPQLYNAAILVDNSGDMQVYRKRILVPFGEYIPGEPFWKRVLSLIGMGHFARGSFTEGTRPGVLHLGSGDLAPLICFEVAFPELVKDQARLPSHKIMAYVLLGDISWFHERRGQVAAQMLAHTRLRAIEAEKPVLVSINAGPLALIDEWGQIQSLQVKATSLGIR